jgi:hypothetical protein
MKRRVCGLIAGLLLLGPLSAQAAGVADLSWLTGCWIQKTGDRTIEEVWLAPRGGAMFGAGRTLKGDAVRNYEFTRIETLSGVVTFTAIPSGQAEASFAAIKQGPTEIVFENKAHDFPQRVIYRTTGKDRLEAAIEGVMAGQLKTINFVYDRCPAL